MEEWRQDANCIADLSAVAPPTINEDGTALYHYAFPAQDYKIDINSRVIDIATLSIVGEVAQLDKQNHRLQLSRPATLPPLPVELSVSADIPVSGNMIRASIYRHAEKMLRADMPTLAHQLLCDAPPVIDGHRHGAPIRITERAQVITAIANLNNSYLFIQGPPGTGKSRLIAQAIVDLIRAGYRIGVSAQSHYAIHNVLRKIEEAAHDAGIEFRGVKKATARRADSFYESDRVENRTRVREFGFREDLYAGTVWLFAHPAMEDRLDYLFIDEAGQLSLANVIAMMNCARNIVFAGDQMQLASPQQSDGDGAGIAGMSPLDFLTRADRHDTGNVISDRYGVFLDTTYRCHPSICRFISDAFYDDQLLADARTARRSLYRPDGEAVSGGIRLIDLDHRGFRQQNPQEAQRIAQLYEEFLGMRYDDGIGERMMSDADILVIAPYNAQVHCLKSILPPSARVGTIDKFQGQEAAIVLLSMCASGDEDHSVNIDFLSNPNRLNVAISRAQYLAVVLCNERLCDMRCVTPAQARGVGALCRLFETAR